MGMLWFDSPAEQWSQALPIGNGRLGAMIFGGNRSPRLAEAAEKTLERRLHYGGGHTGWSCAWIVNLYARLGNGEKALENLDKLWKQSTFPNLMDTHPRGEGYVFQIDGNLGATAAIAEMLVQSNEERVLLLPALPKEWDCGTVKGLTVWGGARIDIAWEEGKLVSCRLVSDKEMSVKIVYDGIARQILLQEKIPQIIQF